MTEDEWLAARELGAMLKFLRLKCGDRKLRLFCCACVRSLPADFPDGVCRNTAEIGEKVADGLLPKEEQEKSAAELRVYYMNYGDGFASWAYASELAHIAVNTNHPWGHLIAVSAQQAVGQSVVEGMTEEATILEQLVHIQPSLLRDIFGNLFRPVMFDSAWRTDTVISLAQDMYESRDFGAMPILADALQDAGCENSDILNHCRDATAAHVRGCWVVDLVLGKS